MQESRAITSGRRHAERVPQMSSNRLDDLFVLRRLLDVIEQRNVISGMSAAQMRCYERVERFSRAQLITGLGVAVNLQAVTLSAKLLIGKLAFLLVDLEKMFCVVFALLHVWLVKRIDSQHRSCDCRGELPQVELFAKVKRVVKRPSYNWMSRGLKRAKFRVGVPVNRTDADVHKQPIIAIDTRRAQCLARDWDYAFAFFAGAFGD